MSKKSKFWIISLLLLDNIPCLEMKIRRAWRGSATGSAEIFGMVGPFKCKGPFCRS